VLEHEDREQDVVPSVVLGPQVLDPHLVTLGDVRVVGDGRVRVGADQHRVPATQRTQTS
jgi:hypothetical protein